MEFTSSLEKKAKALREDMPAFNRQQAFKAAALIYKKAGKEEHRLAYAFRKMAADDPGPAANLVASCVHRALGKSELRKRANMEKLASPGLMGLASSMVPGTVASAADAAKILLAGGLLTGGVVGAGVFGTKKMMGAENDKLLKLEQERNIMGRMTRDIENELKLRNLDHTPENKAAVVDYLT